MPTPVADFFENLLDSISGKTSKDITQAQIDAATQIAIAQSEAEAAKSSPEALEERRKMVIGIVTAVSVAAIIITILWIKYK